MKTIEQIMVPKIPGVKIEPRHMRALINGLDDKRRSLPPSLKITDADVFEVVLAVTPGPEHLGRKHLQKVQLYRNALRHRLYALSWAFKDPRLRRYGEITAKVVDVDDDVIRAACRARLVVRDMFGWFDIKDLVRCIEKERGNVEA